MLYFFARAMQGKGFLNQPGFSVPLIWYHFVFKEHMRNWNPNVKLTCLVLCNLTYAEHIFHRWGNRPPESPEFTQVLMWTQDYISCLLSPSSSWFLPCGTGASTPPFPGLYFLLLSCRLPWQIQQSQAPIPTGTTEIAWVSGLGVSWWKALGTMTNQKA